MVQLGHCTRCRTHTSEVWSRKDACTVCGSPLEHPVVEMGGIEWVPRAFNVLGLGSLVVAIVMIFYYLMSASSDNLLLTACIVLFAGGGLLFTASLLSQMYISDQAIKRMEEAPTRRMPRALRGGREPRGREPRSGPMPSLERRQPPPMRPQGGSGRVGRKVPLR